MNSDEFGNIDFEDLKQKCEKHSKNISAFMVITLLYVCMYVMLCMYVPKKFNLGPLFTV